jgi:amino acid efflux transporter
MPTSKPAVPPTTPSGQLNKTIGLYGAVALGLGIVLGAGMLSLPGLVYQEAGGWSVLVWLFDGLLVLPLLFVFASLGRRFPNAGGVAGFVAKAYPRLKPGCSYLLVGTFSLGLPGIAIAGAGYLADGLGVGGGDEGRWAIAALAAVVIGAVLIMAWFGSTVAGAIQNAVVTLLVICLVVVTVSAAPHWGAIDYTAGDPTWHGVWSGMGLAFFAYTGWEMLAFTAEEFKNPKRDFPLAIAITFVLVLALYAGAMLAVQALLTVDDPRLASAPFLAVIEGAVGGAMASYALVAIVVAIIVTNLNGAIWAASRLLYDIGRSGWAPAGLQLQRLEGTAATPRRAVAVLALLFVAILGIFAFGALDLADLLRIAGQNFFLLYMLSIIAYLKIEPRLSRRIFAMAALAVCTLFAGVFGWGLLYAAALFALPYLRRGPNFRRARLTQPALGD